MDLMGFIDINMDYLGYLFGFDLDIQNNNIRKNIWGTLGLFEAPNIPHHI